MASTPDVSVEIVAGIDNDPHSCATYARMHDRPAHCVDIADLAEDSALLASFVSNWRLGDYDRVVMIGCAPCQGFAAHRKFIDEDDPRRHLFAVFCEIARKINPDAIFMENVPDLLSRKHWKYYSTGRCLLEASDYHVRAQIYNFAEFGLPQERFRTVILALKEEFEMPDGFLEPEQFRTVRDAIGGLPPLEAGGMCPDDPMHRTSNHRQSTIDILKRVPVDGGNRPIGVGPACLDRARKSHGGYTDVYGRLRWDRPSVTITARCRTPSCGRFAHPEQHRGLSIREAALLQGFPKDFMFEGNFDDKYKQIGNAVPPIVAEQFGKYLIQIMLGKTTNFATRNGADIEAPVGPGFAVKINGIKRKRSREMIGGATVA